jgi:membrane fusion protein (multidrug efflux system)
MLGALALLGLGTREATAAPGESGAAPPPGVLVEAVQSRLVGRQGRFIGTIQAIQSVDVMARVEGFLTEVAFDQGSTVAVGQLLYQIDQAPFQADLEAANAQYAAAQAELASAQAALLNAQAQFLRYSNLVGRGDTSQADFDKAKANRDEAQANVDKAKASELQAQAQITTAKINLGYTTITSVIAGRIGATNYTIGNLVGPDSKTLATVVQLDPIRAVFSIPSANFVRFMDRVASKGMDTARQEFVPELILPTGMTYIHKGKLAFASNEIDSGTGTVPIYADFPNPNGALLPGQFVTVVLHTAEEQRLPVVAASAVQQTRDGDQVFVVGKDNRAELRAIKLGPQVGTGFAVTSGLQDGDIVIVSGIQKVKPGMVVAPSKAPAVPADQGGESGAGN